METAPQSSVAVGVTTTGKDSPQLMVAFAGTLLITGATSSDTLIICIAIASLPHASTAVHFLVIVYSLSQVPFSLHSK